MSYVKVSIKAINSVNVTYFDQQKKYKYLRNILEVIFSYTYYL